MDSLTPTDLLDSTSPPPPPTSTPPPHMSRRRLVIFLVGVAVMLLAGVSAVLLYHYSHSPIDPPKTVVPLPQSPWKPSYLDQPNGPVNFLEKSPLQLAGAAMWSAVKVLVSLVVPVFALSMLMVFLFISPTSIPMATRLLLMFVAVVVLLAVIFNVGFPSLDDLLAPSGPESAVDALRSKNSYYFFSHPIEEMTPVAFSALLFYHLRDLPIYFSASGRGLEQDPLGVANLVSTIGLDMLGDDWNYLPSDYYPDGIEMAGRSKLEWSPRVAVQPVNHYTWSRWCHRGHLLEQYGDDTIGVNLQKMVFVVADGVSGSQIPAHARYASLAVVLAVLERVGVESATLFETVGPLLLQLLPFFHVVNLCGSTTMTAASIADDGLLSVVQLGDSVCVVEREGRVVFHTAPTTHSFNCPYQFSSDWSPSTAPLKYYRFALKPGDRILLYSDGVGDNLWVKDVVRLGSAGRIAAKAVQVFTEGFTTDIPFNELFPGSSRGKRDDVSVLSIEYSALCSL